MLLGNGVPFLTKPSDSDFLWEKEENGRTGTRLQKSEGRVGRQASYPIPQAVLGQNKKYPKAHLT